MKRLLSILLCLLAALLFCGAAAQPAPAETPAPEAPTPALEAYFFRAGKADAILLRTAHGAVLIDAGKKGFGKEIVDYCAAQGVEALDYLIVTHFDKDHVGGAAKVLRALPVGQVLQSCYEKDSKEYGNYRKALRKAGLEAVTVREALDFTLDGVRFHVDPPRLERYADSPSNNASLIVTVSCGDCRLLFTGDAESARLTEWLEGEPGPFAFVKMPHHGDWNSAILPLLEETRPLCAVVTCSNKEPEDPRTRDLLERFEVETFYTREAPVLLACDGEQVTLRYEGK